MDKIVISGIRAKGFHGVLPEERKAGQSFTVDCELFLNLNSAIKSDDLTKTIDYAEVALVVREIVEGPPFNLIEALAGKIGFRSFSSRPWLNKWNCGRWCACH